MFDCLAVSHVCQVASGHVAASSLTQKHAIARIFLVLNAKQHKQQKKRASIQAVRCSQAMWVVSLKELLFIRVKSGQKQWLGQGRAYDLLVPNSPPG